MSIAVEVYAYFAAPAKGEGDVFVALSVGYVFHDNQEHFIGGFVAPCQLAGGIVGVEWVVCGVVIGGNGVDLGSRSYFLILGEGVIALPVKIPVFNTDEVGAVALWIRGIDFPGFAQQVHVRVDGQEADIPIDEECRVKCFDLVSRDDKDIVDSNFFYGGAAVSLFSEQDPE